MTRTLFVAVVTFALFASAERPPARAHALPDVVAGVDALTPGARFVATLPPKMQATLRREGQVVLDSKQGDGEQALLRAVMRFDRPVDEVFSIITQPSQQARYLPHVTQSKTVGARSETGEVNDMVVSFLFTFRFRIQHWFYPEERRMEWSLDPSGEDGLTEQAGFFQLYALDEKTTIAEYGTRVVARDGFLNFLRGIGERGGVAEALSAIRSHVSASKR